jgi:prevent-host-death family protein
MASATIAQLHDSLDDYLRKAERGEEVIVTNDGLPMARIVPMQYHRELSDHERRMVAEGRMTLAKEPWDPSIFKRERPASSTTSVLEALLEERAEGR